MGGHGSSSGYKKGAEQAIYDLKKKMADDATFSYVDFKTAKKEIQNKYGLTSKEYVELAAKVQADMDAAEAAKLTSTTNVEAAKNLPGQNGNPWPPDKDSNHLAYEGGKGLGIWNQFGGGVKNGGVDSKTAKEMYGAVASFTGSGYSSIRAAQASGNTTSMAGKNGVTCEKFIEAGVKSGNGWTGGPTYRGIEFISDTAFKGYASLKPGDSVDANNGGTASWSTHKNTAFKQFSGGNNSVVFVHLGSKQPKGVSVDSISTCKGEKEVLVSKDAKFKVQNVAQFAGNGEVGYSGTNYLLVYVVDD